MPLILPTLSPRGGDIDIGVVHPILTDFVNSAVAPGAVVSTDRWQGYDGLTRAGFVHQPTSIAASGDRPTSRSHARTAFPRCSSAGCSAPRSGPRAATRLLPARVHLPLQPPRLAPVRPSLPPPARAGDADRPRPRHSNRRRSRMSTQGALAPSLQIADFRGCVPSYGTPTRSPTFRGGATRR